LSARAMPTAPWWTSRLVASARPTAPCVTVIGPTAVDALGSGQASAAIWSSAGAADAIGSMSVSAGRAAAAARFRGFGLGLVIRADLSETKRDGEAYSTLSCAGRHARSTALGRYVGQHL